MIMCDSELTTIWESSSEKKPTQKSAQLIIAGNFSRNQVIFPPPPFQLLEKGANHRQISHPQVAVVER